MPRIPVYNQQVSYAVPTVRNVEVARPVARIPDARATNLKNISEGITFVKKFPELRDKAWETWLGLKPELNDPVGSIRAWWKNGKEPPVKPGKTRTKPEEEEPQEPEDPEEPEDSQTPPAPAGAPQKPANKERVLFSASRRGLLNAVSSGANGKSGVEGLDAYAAKAWNDLGANGQERELFAQDYAVLRRELASMEESRAAAQYKQNWEDNARFSGRMASVIRTPQAFGAYLDDHATRLEREAEELGLDGSAAAQQFKENAVAQNVETALAAGEPASARAVYRAHGEILPPDRRDVLEEKMRCAEAQDAGYALWKRAAEELDDPSEENVRRFALDETRGEEKSFQTRTAAYATWCARREERQKARLQSESFRRLREAENPEGAARALWSGYAQDAADVERKRKAVQRVFSEPCRASDPFAFNRLHGQLQAGELNQKTLDKYFNEGSVSGRDYLLLNERLSARQSGQTDEEENLLRLAVERFCRKKDLSAQDAELVKYRVYAQPGGAKDRLAALGRMKKWLVD